MEFRGSTNLYRKSGFGLHQLRNCLRSDFCSSQARSRGEGMLRKAESVTFGGHMTVCDRLEIMLVSADDFRKPVADARKERFGARPGRAVMSRRRWRMNPYFHSSTVLEARREGRGDLLVTKTALYFSLPRL